jgi:AcrR family transcriptional regulator
VSEPARVGRERPISRDIVVETALRLVEEHDVTALTMRRLAGELGTAVTSIYWHVGSRDELLDLLVERLVADMRAVRLVGRTPRARIASLCRQWRQRLWERPHLIAIAHQRGKTALLFQPAQSALAGELAKVGLRGRPAADVVQALQFHVVASVVMQRTADRGPPADVTDPAAWSGVSDDPELITALAHPLDHRAVFDLGLEALLDRMLP